MELTRDQFFLRSSAEHSRTLEVLEIEAHRKNDVTRSRGLGKSHRDRAWLSVCGCCSPRHNKKVQQALLQAKSRKLIPDTLMLAEHKDKALDELGIRQLAGYAVFNRGTSWKEERYLRALEDVFVGLADEWGIVAMRKEGFPGIWDGGKRLAKSSVSISRGIALIDFSLRYQWREKEKLAKRLIGPSGLPEEEAVLRGRSGESIAREEVIATLIHHFSSKFFLSFTEKQWGELSLLAGAAKEQRSSEIPEPFLVKP